MIPSLNDFGYTINLFLFKFDLKSLKGLLCFILLLSVHSGAQCQLYNQHSTGKNATNIGNVQGNVIYQRESEAKSRGEYNIPNVHGMTYHDARKKLLEDGWIPNRRHWSHEADVEVQSGNGPTFWEKGYHELDSCSGTGLAQCRFEFNDPSGRLLIIITAGEESDDDSYHASVDRVFLETK